MAPAKSRTKVAVIGAGAAGLCAGRHLLANSEHFEFDIYEQQDEVGGTWKYSDHIGKDEYGLPVHSSMYTNLRTNLPKEAMAFPDFPFNDCNGNSFVHHTEVLQYLKDYAKHFGLYKYIKFNKFIEHVRPLKQEGITEWSVSFIDVVTKEKETYFYDSVMVCNGHYSVPYVPPLPGLDQFGGVVMHSHDYRTPEEFSGLRVVVLGAGASGIDIGIELCTTAKEVVLSHNTPFKKCPLPPNMVQEKGIASIDKKGVTFLDGKHYECDAILVCTGYLYHYPFMAPECGLEIGDQKVTPLYLHMFLIDYPTLAIWAVPKLILPFPIYDQQAKVYIKFLRGSIVLPCAETMRREMEEDFRERQELGMKSRHAHVMPGELQWRYDDKLSALGQIDPISDAVRNLFRHVHHTRTLDVVHYKDTKYQLVGDKFVEVE